MLDFSADTCSPDTISTTIVDEGPNDNLNAQVIPPANTHTSNTIPAPDIDEDSIDAPWDLSTDTRKADIPNVNKGPNDAVVDTNKSSKASASSLPAVQSDVENSSDKYEAQVMTTESNSVMLNKRKSVNPEGKPPLSRKKLKCSKNSFSNKAEMTPEMIRLVARNLGTDSATAYHNDHCVDIYTRWASGLSDYFSACDGDAVLSHVVDALDNIIIEAPKGPSLTLAYFKLSCALTAFDAAVTKGYFLPEFGTTYCIRKRSKIKSLYLELRTVKEAQMWDAFRHADRTFVLAGSNPRFLCLLSKGAGTAM